MGDWDDRSAVGEGITARTEVVELLRSNRDRAEAIARSIRHPWYRCQSLAYVAETSEDPGTRDALIDEALRAGSELQEPKPRVAAASKPLAVLAAAAHGDKLERETERLLRDCDTEPHTLRRLWALWYLIGAVWVRHPLRDRVLDSFLATAVDSHGRGRDRLICNVAERLGQAGDDRAAEVAGIIEGGQARRRALRLGTPAMADPHRKGWIWLTPRIQVAPFSMDAPIDDDRGSDAPAGAG